MLAFSFLLTNGVSAGEAIIPYWSTYINNSACFSISNISAVQVSFKFELIDGDGIPYAGPLDFPKNISSLNQNTSLPAGKSAEFCLRPGSNKYGYGVITTESPAGQGKGFVVARGYDYKSSTITNGAQITINNGLPF